MESNDLPYKSRPAYFTISFGILALLFFGFLIHLIYASKNLGGEVNNSTTKIIFYTILSVFLFFGLASIFFLSIRSPIYVITESELIITRPFLFVQRKILIADIERIDEKDFNIKIMNDSITGQSIYTGRKGLLILNSGKSIEISSIEAGGYKMLIARLRKQWIKVMASAPHHTTKL